MIGGVGLWPYTDFERIQIRAEVMRRGRPIVPELLVSAAELLAGQQFSGSDGPVGDVGRHTRVHRRSKRVRDVSYSRTNRTREQLFAECLDCIERLNVCAMRRVVPSESNSSRTVLHPTAIKATSFNDLGAAAGLYRTWLAEEGKDPAQWLPLARQRAVKRLGGDDPDAIYMSAEFLFFRGADRKQLVAPLAKVAGELNAGPELGLWSYRGQRSTMPIATGCGCCPVLARSLVRTPRCSSASERARGKCFGLL